ncbi:hypothetical protein GYMLUDRAFT_36315 [Collybiopsis luxurians FD-317 M1]|nr:hypothetical protein GYMLUDRAFT_36315 [Collybiopsis luxurians FD-317 M1]
MAKKTKAQKAVEKEELIQRAVQGIRDGTYKNPVHAAKELGIESQSDTIHRQKKMAKPNALGMLMSSSSFSLRYRKSRLLNGASSSLQLRIPFQSTALLPR